jgi:hypothetical protein
MPDWECAVDGCGRRFEAVERAIDHQEREHGNRKCRVCGAAVADGYPAIAHAFEEHTRAEYVRAYGADADAIRVREAVKGAIEREMGSRQVLERADGG